MSDGGKPDGGEAARAAAEWWRKLADAGAPGPVRADRARLRRTRVRIDAREGAVFDWEEAWNCAAFWALRRAVDDAGWRVDDERLALVASLLARVREDAPGVAVGRHFAAREAGDRPALSEERFRRLLRAETLLDAHAPVARAIDTLVSAPVAGLARGLLGWGPRVRRAWAHEYWTGFHDTGEKAA